MSFDVIKKCLVLGYSERYGDRKGIGRFGVGFTLGSHHECKTIEVYSKTKDSEWHQVFFLDPEGNVVEVHQKIS